MTPETLQPSSHPAAAPRVAAGDVVLVTGASGFIGAALVRRLALAGCRVVGVGRRPVAAAALPANASHYQLDLCAAEGTSVLPRAAVVAHCAYPSDGRGSADAQTLTKRDVAMLDAAAKMASAWDARLVLASTGSLYGTASAPFMETAPVGTDQDIDGYLAAKLAVERKLAELSRLSPSLSPLFLRFFFPYGPGMRSGTLFDRLVWPELGMAPVILDGPEGLLTNPIHIDDAAEAVWRLLSVGAVGPVNIGGPEVTSLRRFGDIAAKMAGVAPRYVEQPARRPPWLAGALDRLTALTGWTPAVGVAQGVARVRQDGRASHATPPND